VLGKNWIRDFKFGRESCESGDRHPKTVVTKKTIWTQFAAELKLIGHEIGFRGLFLVREVLISRTVAYKIN
jgi:hypothetical protein